MTAAFIAFVGGLLLALGAFIFSLFDRKSAKADGAVMATAKVSEVAAVKEAAIADAVVKAPDTKAEVVDRLNAGKF